MNAATVTIQSADSDACVTRERRYASGSEGGAIDLTVARKTRGTWGAATSGSGYEVRWAVNRGRGWGKAYVATRATEAEALAFANEKWPVLVAWLERLEPVSSGGAAAAFSAQVVTMLR